MNWIKHTTNKQPVPDDTIVHVRFKNGEVSTKENAKQFYWGETSSCRIIDYMIIKENPLNTQIGGSHYKDCKIQPIEFIHANSLGFLEGCVIKRLARHKHKTGKGRQDIEKAIHELQLLLELEYGNE